jgi:hypothetical protein
MALTSLKQQLSIAAQFVFFRNSLMIFAGAPDHVLKFPL